MKTKKQRGKHRRRMKSRREERRQDRLNAPLRTSEGIRKIDELDEFFCGYSQNPDADRFTWALGVIQELNLLRLQSHRAGIAAMVVSVYAQHPDRQKSWKTKYRQIVDAAHHLFDPEKDIKDVSQVDQTMAAWVVTRQEHLVDQVLDLLPTGDEMSKQAAHVLSYYMERWPELEQIHREWKEALVAKTADDDCEQRKQQAIALANALQEHPDRHRIAYVVYDQGAFHLGTYDGKEVDDIPSEWEGVPVRQRKATEVERQAVSAWQTGQQDPV